MLHSKRILNIKFYRAGHTFAFTNPYGKGVADITTPIFIQYGDFNTGNVYFFRPNKNIPF